DVVAQGPPPGPPPPGGGQPAPTFRPEELEQLVAPIALYPDPLLAQIFMASTYPLEVVQADRFVKANAQLKGPQLDDALKQQTWDDSVKSLVSFPPVLSMMSEKLDWTQKLGDAVLADQRGVLNAVQVLRARAQAAGNLKTTAEQRVIVEPAPPPPPPVVQPGEGQMVVVQPPAPPPQIIQIQPADPQAVQLPAYNPAQIYGPWPYPAYPPYPYYPPGYYAGAALLTFGAGMAVGAALWGNCNWGGGDININRSNYQNFTNNVNRSDIANNRIQNLPAREGGRGNWQHSPQHRQAVPYRDQGTAQRFGQGTRPGADSREAFRGRADAGRQQLGQGGFGDRGGFGGQGGPGGFGGQRGQGGFDRGPGGGMGDRGGFGGSQGFGGGRQPGAFQGMGQGGQTRDFSNRGQTSRQGMSAPRASSGGGAPRGGGGAAPRGGGGGGAPRGGGGGGRRR
ncbi:MAG TPA: DUF3300 domain-containing protein, partial [Candidatus Methylomirabilis sp.]